MSNELLAIIVRRPGQTVFSGQVTSVSSVNEKGPFDILPEHTNYIAIISQTLNWQPVKGAAAQMPIKRGVIWVKKNAIEVYLDL